MTSHSQNLLTPLDRFVSLSSPGEFSQTKQWLRTLQDPRDPPTLVTCWITVSSRALPTRLLMMSSSGWKQLEKQKGRSSSSTPV